MPKRIFFEIDKRQAEWVITAYYAQEARMIDVCETNRDPHTATGSLISGMPEDLVKTEHKAVGHLSDPSEIALVRREIPELGRGNFFLTRNMSVRQAGKKSNHGLNYGMGPGRFAKENEVDFSDAKRCYETYHRAYPGLKSNMYAGIQRQLRENRTLTNCFGRKRRFLDAWGEDLFKAAYSFVPQSTNVGMVNRAIRQVYKDDRPFMTKAELMAQVHDSILYQYPILENNDWTDMAAAIQQIEWYLRPTIQYWGREFQVKSDLKIGLHWGEWDNKTHRGMYEIPLAAWTIEDIKTKLEMAWEIFLAPAAV